MWLVVLNINLKVPELSCQMKVRVMTLVNDSREPAGGRTRDAIARTNVDKGTGELTYNTDSSPSSRGVSHDSRATSTIGQGSEHLSDTYEQHKKSVPTFVYNEYILCYVDDILVISHDSTSMLKAVQVNFRFKDDKIGPPET